MPDGKVRNEGKPVNRPCNSGAGGRIDHDRTGAAATAHSREGDVFCIPDEPQSFSAADGLIRRRETQITADTTWLRESPAATNRADTGAPLLIESQTWWYFVMSPK